MIESEETENMRQSDTDESKTSQTQSVNQDSKFSKTESNPVLTEIVEERERNEEDGNDSKLIS